MTSGTFLSAVSLPFCLASGILYKYANMMKQNKLVMLAVFIAWYFSFYMMLVVPLDVTCTLYRQRVAKYKWSDAPWSRNANELPVTVVAYWTSQILSWFIFPLMLSSTKSGEFHVLGKLKSALVENAIHYGSVLIICGLLAIYVAVAPQLHFDWLTTLAIISSASNSWGLVLLIPLLGYSLVEIPRGLWISATPEYRLQQAYYKVAKISADRCAAEGALDDVVESVLSIASCVKPQDPFYTEMEIIIHKVPASLLQQNKVQFAAACDDSMVSPTLNSLVQIHKQLINDLHVSKLCNTKWILAVRNAILLEDIQHNHRSSTRTFKHTSSTTPALITPTLEWYWRCLIQDYVYQAAAILCGTLSAMVVWSEVTFSFQSPVLSLFAVFRRVFSHEYKAIEILSALTIVYLCICAFYTLLRMRIFNHYLLVPRHQTNERSSIFFGMMLCRLIPPVCLNYLGLIHLDSHVIETQTLEPFYTQAMGNVAVLSIISDGLNTYFPMAVLVFCLATYFNLGPRLLSLVGLHQVLDVEEPTAELVEEGKKLVDSEKRKLLKSDEAVNSL